MAEFDLIPADYRAALVRGRWLRRAGAALVVTLCLVGSSYAALHYRMRAVNADVDALRARRAVNENRSNELVELRRQKGQLAYQLSLLDGLRGGTPAQRMFTIIQRALASDQVWFRRWRFQRAGTAVEQARPSSTDTGYFIVIDKPEPSAAQQRVWQIETHMTITGQSLDHAALSEFIGQLFAQPEIDDVRVLRTAQRGVGSTRVIDFELAIVVRAGGDA